jgi:hypothetical protein
LPIYPVNDEIAMLLCTNYVLGHEVRLNAKLGAARVETNAAMHLKHKILCPLCRNHFSLLQLSSTAAVTALRSDGPARLQQQCGRHAFRKHSGRITMADGN